MAIEMVAGFILDMARQNVLLIEKSRPEWQKGRVNGIGGKIKEGENRYKAMVRESEEETGLTIETFLHYATINGSGWRVYFFVTVIEPLYLIEDTTDEGTLLIAPVRNLPENVLYNLNWLIPLALDEDILRPSIIYDKTKYNGLEKYIIWDD